MKNKLFIFSAILLVAVTTITIVSCKKDKTEESNPSAENIAKNIVSTENEDTDNMDKYLLSLKEKLQNATKGGETMNLEQAQRDLSNLLNFDFGDANYATDTFLSDTFHVKLSLTDGMVDLSQLAETYSDAFDQILTSYRSLDLPDKSVYSIHCNYDNANNKDNDSEDIGVVVTYRGFAGNSFPMNGHDTLSWHPRRSDSSCDNPNIVAGGALIMQHWIMNSQQQIACLNGGRVYFTEQDDWFKNGNDTYDPITGRYKIFTVFTNRIDTVCISHEDMEYYYANILAYYHQETPSSHSMEFAYVDCFCTPLPQPNPDHHPGDCWYWRIQIRHGKFNCTNSEPIK